MDTHQTPGHAVHGQADPPSLFTDRPISPFLEKGIESSAAWFGRNPSAQGDQLRKRLIKGIREEHSALMHLKTLFHLRWAVFHCVNHNNIGIQHVLQN